MEIPRFWARAEGEATGGGGRRYHLRVWGWSSQSVALAQERARSRLQLAIAKLASGKEPADHYPYLRAPVREEQIEELRGPAETTAAIVTRNRYGALVLNAARAMFIDVDVVPAKKKLGWFRRAPAGSDPELDALRPVLERAAPRTFRVYRTAAGFRLLVVDREFDPSSDEAEALMTSVGADPRFVALCRTQSSFRARLTPKPWRCGCPSPSFTFPFEDEAAVRAFAEWLARYEKACAGKATCRFVEQVGASRPLESLRPLVDLHDTRTRASETLPLA